MRRVRRVAALVGTVAATVVVPPGDVAAHEGHVLVDHLRGVGDARQVIAVVNDSWTATTATFVGYEKDTAGRWRRVAGPWAARIGRAGFGSPKREGDGQTPVGSFPVTASFSVQPSPGTRLRWFRATKADVWVDDSDSAYYNTWQRLPVNGRWTSAESLYQPTAYAYAAVVGYNVSRTPGAGSAIFLHAATGNATAGCVTVTAAQVVWALRWLDPAKRPRIVMGPRSAVIQ